MALRFRPAMKQNSGGENDLPKMVEAVRPRVVEGAKKPDAMPATSDSLFDARPQKRAQSSMPTVDTKLQRALEELDSLVGLDEVKQLVREFSAFIEIQKRRARAGLATEPLALHMVFRGNPGTGKTTVARILGRALKEMGVLQKGHLVEVERADLVGEYIGHTAQKTREQVKKALGGILFIDEAYSLARGGEKDFGKEAIDTMVKAMEDHKHELILILAGYRDEMARFLDTNPGLKSRFPIHMEFKDYSCEQLFEIAVLMLYQRQYSVSAEAEEKLSDILRNAKGRYELRQGNARFARNLIEKAVRRQAVRLVAQNDCSRDELMSIEKQDFAEAAHMLNREWIA